MFEFKLDNTNVSKSEFIEKTNGKTINIERIGKLFNNKKFNRTQFIMYVSCDELELESKMYISPIVKDDGVLYFGPKSFLHPLLSYALTGSILNRGITLDMSTVREALEATTYKLNYDLNHKYPVIKGVE